MSKAAFGLIVGSVGTAFFGWILYSGFRSRVMRFDYMSLHFHGHRKDQPVRFCLACCLNGFGFMAGLILIAFSLAHL